MALTRVQMKSRPSRFIAPLAAQPRGRWRARPCSSGGRRSAGSRGARDWHVRSRGPDRGKRPLQVPCVHRCYAAAVHPVPVRHGPTARRGACATPDRVLRNAAAAARCALS